ncbi:MAG: phage Tail Collar [Phycisphaerales bacterium]|nr:phage Tail Collar [Phycisphaerales bacterium]
MATPYVGEIRLVGFNFPPQGWALCNGQLMSIAQNDVLFALIGTTYGGDGVNTFGLPNLQGRVPIHQGAGFVIGDSVGTENVAVLTSQIPPHNHVVITANGLGNQASPAGGSFAASVARQYSSAPPNIAMGSPTGLNPGGQPHDNMLPFTAVNYIISLFGIFPSRS